MNDVIVSDKEEAYTVERTFMDEFSPESAVERVIRVHIEDREETGTRQQETVSEVRA